MKVKVYSTPTCPFCIKAKKFLKKRGIPFEDIDVSENEKAAENMLDKSGQSGVPVIELGKKILVGFDEEEMQEALDEAKEKEELF